MEQMSFDEFYSEEISIDAIREVASAVENDHSIKAGTFRFRENKHKEKIYGYSVMFNTSLAAKIEIKKYVFSVNKKYVGNDIIFGFTKSKELRDPQDFIKFEYKNSKLFWNCFKNTLSAFVTAYVSPERFGCCHRYVECSNARKCIAPDPIHAKGCYYKENLENGRIFYGKNANI